MNNRERQIRTMLTPNFGQDEFIAPVKNMFEIMRRKPAYVLGVADQVPPDGILERVAQVVALRDEFGRY